MRVALKLENIEKKSQTRVETVYSLPYRNFCKSIHKAYKSRYQNFLALSNFIGFLYFVPNILSWSVELAIK